ncbi:MAG: protein translocase subunit SecF, partial [Patescibacteria group bacterium]
IWYALSLLIVIASLFAAFKLGLKQGIDFTGGALLEVEYQDNRPETSLAQKAIEDLDFGPALIQPSGEKNFIIRMKDISEEQHQRILSAVSSLGTAKEIRFDSIGPVIGKELKKKSIIAIILVVVMIILYIALAFRKVSKPVNSFYYGLMAVVALIHDVSLPTGVFAVLGYYYGVEVDTLFVTALLTVLGFSVHDTIVVFDRVRENLKLAGEENFENTVGASINQTISRSINTSLTVILVLLAIFFLGGESTKYFSLALMIGVAIGTYSSIFLASPLLVTIEKWQSRGK